MMWNATRGNHRSSNGGSLLVFVICLALGVLLTCQIAGARPAARKKLPVARLKDVKGMVQVRPALPTGSRHSTAFIRARERHPLYSGDTVRTGRTGKVRIV